MRFFHCFSVLFLLAAAAAPAAPSRPNILLLIADDWGLHAGAYGTPWVKTPAFDRVAREGLLFRNAFTPNAKCAPSRAILLTGRHSWQLEEAANHMAFWPAKFKSFPEALAGHGYTTGITGKGWAPGIAKNADGSRRELCGPAWNRQTQPPPASGISNNNYSANFADFLSSVPADTPWFFWCGPVEPHRGYEPGSGIARGGKKLTDIDRVPACWPDNDTVRGDLLDYAFEVEHLDSHLQRILDELERRELLANTLIIVTSDHGMPFPRMKGQAYPGSNHVPLAIRFPAGIPRPGRTVSDFVDFTDLAPTVLDYAQIPQDTSGLAAVTGTTWRPLFESHQSGRIDPRRDHVLIGKERHDAGRPDDAGYPIRGILTENHLYLRNFAPDRWPAGNPETGYLNCDGGATKTFVLEARRRDPADPFWALCFGRRPSVEFYDLTKDPDAVTSLASDPAQQSRLEAMAGQMAAELTAQHDPRMEGEGDLFDHYPIASPDSVHFYQRWKNGEPVKAGWVSPGDFEPAPIE